MTRPPVRHRKPAGERKMGVHVALLPCQRDMLLELGGSAWLQRTIERAHAALLRRQKSPPP